MPTSHICLALQSPPLGASRQALLCIGNFSSLGPCAVSINTGHGTDRTEHTRTNSIRTRPKNRTRVSGLGKSNGTQRRETSKLPTQHDHTNRTHEAECESLDSRPSETETCMYECMYVCSMTRFWVEKPAWMHVCMHMHEGCIRVTRVRSGLHQDMLLFRRIASGLRRGE